MLRLLWTQRQNFGPSARANHKIVYDTQRKQSLLFGGGNQNVAELADTWEWDGNNWTQISDSGPSARRGHGMAYDIARSRAVLFGGTGPQGGPGLFFGDTWEWDGDAWTQMADSGPPPRQALGMAYDSKRGRTVMFGGTGSVPQGIVFGDTWEWDGSQWTQVADSGPALRGLHAMTFDSARGRVVLFGGGVLGGAAAGAYGADTWEWYGNLWTKRTEFGPNGRAGSVIAYDDKRQCSILFGGEALSQAAPAALRDTWEWDGSHWTQRQEMGPTNRVLHAMAYDSARDCMVQFGGTDQVAAPNTYNGDTWELTARTIP